jgi:uncharacterized protein YdaU (DUF1376 family)
LTWSYSGDPSASDLDAIRFWSQLVDEDDQRLSDEEITYLSSEENSIKEAAAACCEVMSTRYASEADIRAGSEGELSIKMSQLSEQFSKRAAMLREAAKESGAKSASPWSASISVAEKAEQEERTDRVEPAFRRGQFDEE